MIITLVVFLFITAAQAQETCNDQISFAAKDKIEEIPYHSFSAIKLNELYEQKRKLLVEEGKEGPVDFFVPMRSDGDYVDPKQVADQLTKKIAWFLEDSKRLNNGVDINYKKENIVCQPTYFGKLIFVEQKVRGADCVVRVCVKSVPYRQAAQSAGPTTK